jgi:hypothetical protein
MITSIAKALPQPDKEPSLEQMLQAMNSDDPVEGEVPDEDAAGVA